MLPQKWAILLLLYVVTPFLSILVRYPWKEEEKVRNAYSLIASNEELYVLDILTVGTVSTLLGGVFPDEQVFMRRSGFIRFSMCHPCT